MSTMSSRKNEALDAFSALVASEAAHDADFFIAAGRVARVAQGEEETERADALLGRAADLMAAAPSPVAAETTAIERWVGLPWGPFARAVDEAERLGALAAGLGALAPDCEAFAAASQASSRVASSLSAAARSGAAAMFEAGLAASRVVAEGGAVTDEDGPLLALCEVVGDRLTAALRGEPLEGVRPVRSTVIEPSLASSLGAALARALRRPEPFEVTPDALALSAALFDSRDAGDLRLHADAPTAAEVAPIELLAGVFVRPLGDEIEVTLTGPTHARPLLVPFVAGEPGAPCPSRTGNDPSHLLFSPSQDPSLDGHALVVGDRIAFLIRRD